MPERLLAPRTDRRDFLRVSALLGGGLAISFSLPLIARSATAATTTSSTFAPNAFIRIDRQGQVTFVIPMVEMGQGIYTAFSMLLAEELEVGLDQVHFEHAPPNDALYANSILHIQTTGLSSSIRAFWTPLREAGRSRACYSLEPRPNAGGAPAPAGRRQCGHSPGARAAWDTASWWMLLPLADASTDSVILKEPTAFTLIVPRPSGSTPRQRQRCCTVWHRRETS